MTPRFVDTNIFLRHFLDDDPVHSPASHALFEAIERGEISVWTTDLAIAEIVFVLSNKRMFNLSREHIRDMILPLIELSGVQLPSKRLYRRIFDLYINQSIDVIDAYHAALMEDDNALELYSFDRHFDRVESLRRVEP